MRRAALLPEPVVVESGSRSVPFPNFPPDSVKEHFLAHVRATGEPDTWEHHDPSAPQGDEFHEIVRFEIPESKRADVGRASCPICSPLAPKYFGGALAWFPQEGVLRAIGHECAKGRFGEAVVARSKIEARRRLAENYLLDTLPTPGPLKVRARSLEPIAAAMDSVRSALFRAGSKTRWTRIAKAGANGTLVIEDLREVHAVDAYGRSSIRMEGEIVERVQVDGLSFLTERFSTLAEARNAIAAAELISTCNAQEAMDLVIALSPKFEDLLDAERLLRTSIDAVNLLERKIAEARAFLAPDNLARLAAWTHNVHIDVGIVVFFTHAMRFQLKGKRRSDPTFRAGI